MILESTITIKKSSKVYKYYINKGYVFNEQGFMDVKIEDLPKNSHVKMNYTPDKY